MLVSSQYPDRVKTHIKTTEVLKMRINQNAAGARRQGSSVLFMAQAAVIAALYTVLTLVAIAMNLAFGAVQFRFSEALTILPVFTPAAIPGLTLGCVLSNLWSSFGVADIVFGSLATLLAALCGYWFRWVQIKGIPWVSVLAPVIFNALIVGAEITFLAPEGFLWPVFGSTALSVGAGELLVCVVLGIPLLLLIRRMKLDEWFFAL